MSEEIRIENHEEPGRPLKVRRLADGRVEVRIGDMGITDVTITPPPRNSTESGTSEPHGTTEGTTSMTKYQEMAKELVKQTRAQVLLTKTNFTTIAESLGVVRQTVSNNLDRDDIPLSMFLAAQVESGGNPSKAIAAALDTNGKEVA